METWLESPGNASRDDDYRRAELAYLRASADASRSLDALLETRPDYLPAHLLAIAKLVAAKDAAALPQLANALDAAAALEHRADSRALAHLAAARAWLARAPLQAAKIYTQLVLEGRDDALSLRLAQSTWYFLGRRENVRCIAEHALRVWSPSSPGFDSVLAMAAFGAAETNDGTRAEELARRALGVERRSPFAIHALAHGLAIQDRPTDGANALRALASDWRVGGRMDGHIGWHLALFALEGGDTQTALAAFDREQLPAALIDAGGSADATDLLWRLELAGVDVGARWDALASAWTRHLEPGFWGFLDVLAGLALQRAGRRADASALVRQLALAPRVAGTVAPALATLPALAALDAFARGAFADASRGFAKALPRLGGSLPQRELLLRTQQTAELRLAAEHAVVPAAA